MDINAAYWENRYDQTNTPWDLGHPSRPLVEYMETWPDANARILIPGAGTANEALWLRKKGLLQVKILDWAENVLKEFQQKYPDFPTEDIIHADFFKHEGEYDLILEQTFMCALPPAMRDAHAEHCARLLKPGGTLAGVFFGFPLIVEKGPPWGGSIPEFQARFSQWFEIVRLEPCMNSEPDRQGKEIFFEFRKKKD